MEQKQRQIKELLNKWLRRHKIAKVQNTLDAFDQLEPFRESVAE
jgi:hypothetical protein